MRGGRGHPFSALLCFHAPLTGLAERDKKSHALVHKEHRTHAHGRHPRSISDGVFTVDLEWRITSFNRAAEEITGVSRSEAIGRLCSEVFRSSLCGDNCPLQDTLASGKPRIGTCGYIITAQESASPSACPRRFS